MIKYTHWYWLPALLLLSACQTAPVAPETNTVSAQPAEQATKVVASPAPTPTFNRLQNFEIEGRMGVQTDGKGISGKMHWQHQHGNDDMGFYSPMGGKIASVTTSSEEVTLIANDGKVYNAPDAETLTENALGWRLPVSNLTDWILGHPKAGNYEDIQLDEQGRISKLTQDGWEIDYLEYQTIEHIALPIKLTLRNPKLYVKLIIERWDISGNDAHLDREHAP